MTRAFTRTGARALFALLAMASAACSSSRAADDNKASAASSAAGSSSVKVPDALPVPAEKVAAVVNPKHQPPYAGAVGKLTGHITMVGDPPPPGLVKIPYKCAEAMATYDKAMRVGADHSLADALVTVTQYDGYVPPKSDAQALKIHGCAFEKRTVALTFGQRLDISNKDPLESYMPYIDGAPVRAVMVAVPNGAPVKAYAQQAGHYFVRDEMPHPFMVADLFVLKFATHDVTGLDGRYAIEGIPVGKVKVNAFLPTIKKTVEKEIEIKEGDNTLDLELAYDAKVDTLAPPPPTTDAWLSKKK